ncbi:MAG: discoidin domain-containing protein, partial [Spirochaetes bacterium]|nr:discoidin domain-containing protein [Spirochaetota bacterium]
GYPDPPHPHEVQIDLGSIYEISGFRYTPRQGNINGRIGQFEFYVSLDGIDWGSAMALGTIENDPMVKEIRFPAVSAQYVRLVALSEVNDRPWTTMAELNVLGATFSGNFAPNGTIATPSDNLSINTGDLVDFSGTGTDPDNNLPLSYSWSFGEGSGVPESYIDNPGPIQFNSPGTFTVCFTVTDASGREDSTPYTRVIKVLDGVNDTIIAQANWYLLYVDSEELVGSDGAAINAFDGNDTTIWHTQWFGDPDPPHPHEIQIDLESAYEIDAFRYLPSSASSDGRINHYEFYLSTDNLDWGLPVATGSFANDESEKHVLFSSKTGRFIRMVALDEVNGNPWTSMAEINIEGQCETPYVSLVQPQDFFLQSSPNLTVTPSACLNSTQYPGWGVKLIIDGGSQAGGYESTITSAPFEATFTGLSNSEHSVEAVIVNNLGQEIVGTSTYDKSYPVGIGGYYVAIGDSITAGVGDGIAGDNISWDYRNKEGGYTPILNNLLSQQKGYPNTVEVEGVPGYTSLDGLQRLPAVLSKHPSAQYYLLMYGTNDAAALLPLSSGLGLQQGDPDFPGSYKDNIQQMINMIKNDGKDVFLAKVPFTLEQATNTVIQEYNQVIDELVVENSIQVNQPDFYSYFEAHQNEFSDSLHPNGNGYQSMGNLWFNALQ